MSPIRDDFNVPLEGHTFSAVLPDTHLDMWCCTASWREKQRVNLDLFWYNYPVLVLK